MLHSVSTRSGLFRPLRLAMDTTVRAVASEQWKTPVEQWRQSGLLRTQQLLHQHTKPEQCTNITWHEGGVPRDCKEALLGQRACVLWFTGASVGLQLAARWQGGWPLTSASVALAGLSGSGKSTVACTLEHALLARGKLTALLDGDNVRHGLNHNLGFSAADRDENIRRVQEVAKLMVDAGVIAIASFISPYRAERERVSARLQPGDFVEVYMKVPLAVCEQRDPKGLYKLARAGKLKSFTGVNDPYEEPANPEITLHAVDEAGKLVSPQAMAQQVLHYLEQRGYLKTPCPLAGHRP